MSLAAKLERLTDDFSLVPDPHERLSLLVDRAKKVLPLPAGDRDAAHRVPGCVSVVWLFAQVDAVGHCHFRADAESPMVRALVIFLCEFFSGAPAAEILATPADPLEALGFVANLSPTRRNGLAAVRGTIRAFAQAQLAP